MPNLSKSETLIFIDFLFFSFSLQGTPAGLVNYKVDQQTQSYSATIFEVEKETGHVITRVNLNEEPNLKFSVSDEYSRRRFLNL